MSKLFNFLIGVILLFASTDMFAQSFYKDRQSRDIILSVGVGPSFSYLDNGGQYRSLNFEIKPSVSVALNKKLTDMFEIRATGGVQWISSGGNPSNDVMDFWTANNSSFTAVGSIYYFDIMPSIYIIPFGHHMNRSMFNFYGGLGLGVMHASTDQTKSYNVDEVPVRVKMTTGYIPVRAGLTYTLGANSDIALEGTLLATFTDAIDGNAGFNKFGDHFIQGQVVYRRYFFSKYKD